MSTRSESEIDRPSQEAMRLFLGLLSDAEAMGILKGKEVDYRLDLDTMRELFQRLNDAGIARQAIGELWSVKSFGQEEFASVLTSVKDALEYSPLPQFEWESLSRLFGAEDLARLVGTSESSVNRYLRGRRSTPPDISERLHFIAKIVGDLKGSYNDLGVRRWFDRPRVALKGKAPAEILQGDWHPEDPAPLAVRELARSLVAAPAS